MQILVRWMVIRRYLKRTLEFRQGVEQIGDEAVVGDLEDRRLLVLVDGDDHLRILHAGQMLDGTGDTAGDIEIGCHHLAGLADLPIVGGIAGIDGGARGADGGTELVGDRQDDFLELLGRAERTAAGDDDLGRGELWPVGGRERIRDEGRETGRKSCRRDLLDGSRWALGGRGKGSSTHRDDSSGISSLNGLDGIAGIDRPLESVGGDNFDDLRHLCDIEEGGDARHDVLAGRGRSRNDRVIAARQRNDQVGERLGEIVGQRIAFGEQNVGDACELGSGIGSRLGALAGDQHVHVAANLGSGRQCLGGLVGKGCVVVVSQKKNGHGRYPFSNLRGRRLRS
ncbi:hypothetical protein RHECNPAF_13300157 [Rhizobium etli CNPAF512]|nr:hypothetical protein RHECNPAF_13300157 [Rhizobium etli CNPAF512]